tara:strand:- start:3338 stop:5488 length:2151 start_codon:yes stop_codon:yes gene_type:complete
MKEDIILEYTSKAGFPTGDLVAYYDLSGSIDTTNESARDRYYKLTTGHTTDVFDTVVIYNQLQETGSQLYDIGDGEPVIALDNYPAQVVSNSRSVTGSGNFGGETTMEVTTPMSGENWTCFLDFSGEYSTANPTLSQVLVSTMTGYDCSSGFHIGINGSNRLYYEYLAGEERTVETLPTHLKTFNLLSIAKTPNTLEFSLHKPDQETVSVKTPLESYTNSHRLLFGGFRPKHDDSNYYDPNLFYTGFSGYINTIAILDDYMTESSRNTFAESFYLDSYDPPGFTTQTRTTKEVTGVEVQSQTIGYGITGYEKVVSGYIKDQNGNSVPVYTDSGVQGLLYKEVLVDLTGQNNIVTETGFYADEVAARKDSYLSSANSMKGSISFAVPLGSSEKLDIYNHSTHLKNINYVSEEVYPFGSYTIDNSEYSVQGFQLKNNNFSYDPSNKQPFIQLYRNGYVQFEVSGLFSVNDIFNNVGGNLKEVGDLLGTYKGNYFINDNNAGAEAAQVNSLNTYPLADRIENNRYEIALNSKDDKLKDDDDIYFDVISGASLTGSYEGSNKHFTGDYIGKDIFFNGQKLISGTDYIQSSTSGKTSYLLQSSSLGSDSAELLFTPQASDNFTHTTYSSAGSNFSVPSVLDEQVWRNGVRQSPGKDYIKTPEDSLIGPSSASSKKNSFIFNTDASVLDVSVKNEEAQLENFRAKIFSFSSEGQKNLFSGSS